MAITYKGITVSPKQLKLANCLEQYIGFKKWFSLEDARKYVPHQTAYLCRELVSKGILEAKKELDHSRLAKIGLSGKPMMKTWKTKYRLVANPPLKKKKMKTQQYDSDMIALFFGANHFKSLGKQTWEKDNYRVKVIAGHKLLITNTDASKKHKHIATVLIPKSDQLMYVLFKDFIGMRL